MAQPRINYTRPENQNTVKNKLDFIPCRAAAGIRRPWASIILTDKSDSIISDCIC